MGVFESINVANIVTGHFRTFKHHRTGELRLYDIILFVGAPMLVAIGLSILGPYPPKMVAPTITSLCIFTGLLLNLLLLTYTIAREGNPPEDEIICEARARFFHKTFNNTSFAILLAITTAAFLFAIGATTDCISPPNEFNLCTVIYWVISFVAYYLGTMFVLTLLLILTNTYSLLSKERFNSSPDS